MSLRVPVETPPCMHCGETSTIEVNEKSLFRWKSLGIHIQTAFPDMSDEDREHLKTGTHPRCWAEMFGNLDDEEDDT